MPMPAPPPFPRAAIAAIAAIAAALSVYLGGLLYAGAVVGAALPGYSHAGTPMAALALRGVPGAAWFNASLVAAGVLAAFAAASLRARLAPSAPWSARIGARLLLLSALAFAAQGLLPLDPRDLDGPGAALRGTAWTIWWPTLALGAALLAFGTRRAGPAASTALLWAGALGFPAAALWSVGLLGPLPETAPHWPERLLPAAWMLWLCLLVWARGAAQEGKPLSAGRDTA